MKLKYKLIYAFLITGIVVMTILLILNLDDVYEYFFTFKYDYPFEYKEEDIKNKITNDVYDVENRTFFYFFYDVVEQINDYCKSDNFQNELYSILNEDYLSYYNITKDNINESLKEFKNNTYIFEDLKYCLSYKPDTYVFLVYCQNDKKLIIKYTLLDSTYSVFLDNYVEDYGLQKFIDDKVVSMLQVNHGNPNDYNVMRMKMYPAKDIVEEYADMLLEMDFNTIYEKYIGQTTKDKYSYDEIYSFINTDAYFFKKHVYVTFKEKKVNDKMAYRYTFKDAHENDFTVNENKPYEFTFDFNINENSTYNKQ